MLFRLVTTMTFSRSIECCDSEAEALAYAKHEAEEANRHNHHGEVTTVEVLRLTDDKQWVPIAASDGGA